MPPKLLREEKKNPKNKSTEQNQRATEPSQCTALTSSSSSSSSSVEKQEVERQGIETHDLLFLNFLKETLQTTLEATPYSSSSSAQDGVALQQRDYQLIEQEKASYKKAQTYLTLAYSYWNKLQDNPRGVERTQTILAHTALNTARQEMLQKGTADPLSSLNEEEPQVVLKLQEAHRLEEAGIFLGKAQDRLEKSSRLLKVLMGSQWSASLSPTMSILESIARQRFREQSEKTQPREPTSSNASLLEKYYQSQLALATLAVKRLHRNYIISWKIAQEALEAGLPWHPQAGEQERIQKNHFDTASEKLGRVQFLVMQARQKIADNNQNSTTTQTPKKNPSSSYLEILLRKSQHVPGNQISSSSSFITLVGKKLEKQQLLNTSANNNSNTQLTWTDVGKTPSKTLRSNKTWKPSKINSNTTWKSSKNDSSNKIGSLSSTDFDNNDSSSNTDSNNNNTWQTVLSPSQTYSSGHSQSSSNNKSSLFQLLHHDATSTDSSEDDSSVVTTQSFLDNQEENDNFKTDEAEQSNNTTNEQEASKGLKPLSNRQRRLQQQRLTTNKRNQEITKRNEQQHQLTQLRNQIPDLEKALDDFRKKEEEAHLAITTAIANQRAPEILDSIFNDLIVHQCCVRNALKTLKETYEQIGDHDDKVAACSADQLNTELALLWTHCGRIDAQLLLAREKEIKNYLPPAALDHWTQRLQLELEAQSKWSHFEATSRQERSKLPKELKKAISEQMEAATFKVQEATLGALWSHAQQLQLTTSQFKKEIDQNSDVHRFEELLRRAQETRDAFAKCVTMIEEQQQNFGINFEEAKKRLSFWEKKTAEWNASSKK